MTQTDPKLVEKSTPLAQSKLWAIQQNYFKHKSLSAWDKDVPSYISSNAYIANLYAAQCLAAMEDWCRLKPGETVTFNILEVAGGTGKFAFYFIKSLNRFIKDKALMHIQFLYVLTDISDETLTFYQENPMLQPFVKAKQCDFAKFDIENDADLTLVNQQQTLSSLAKDTPILVIANYAFDFMTQEILEFHPDRVDSLAVEVKSRFADYDTDKADYVNELTLSFEPKTITIDNYYAEPVLNQLLQVYRDIKKDKPFVVNIPLGLIRFIDNLATLSNGNYMMLCGDKGITSLDEIFTVQKNHQYSTYDGIYTFRVNFHAVAWYIAKKGGNALLAERGVNFKTNVFYQGFEKHSMHQTKWYFNDCMMQFNADDFCVTFDDYYANAYRFEYNTLLGFLRLSQWDPTVYCAVHERIVQLAKNLNDYYKNQFLENLKQVESNLYSIKAHEKAYLFLSDAYDQLDQLDEAVNLGEQGVKIFPKNIDLNGNLGCLYEKQKNSAKAIVQFQKVLELAPKNKLAKKRLATLTGKVTVATFMPVVKAVFVFLCLGASFYLLTK